MKRTEVDFAKQISSFGVSQSAARVYIHLLKSGASGIMALTKHAQLGRNVVYKLLDELIEAQLVSVAHKSFGKEYSAMRSDAFEAIAASKESEAARLRLSLDGITAGLLSLSGSSVASSHVTHYEGVDGLKQVNWNLTKATKEYRVYEQSHMHEYLDETFVAKIRQRYADRGLQSFDLTNRKEVDPYAGVQVTDYWLKGSHYRYIDPEIIDIQFEMYTYDDVVALLDYSAEIPHCMEIRNVKLARMQRQIFDALWAQAQPMHLDPATQRRILTDSSS